MFGRYLVLAATPFVALTACKPSSSPPPPELIVSAAANLSFAMADLAPRYEKATGTRLRVNLASTGQLAEQIRHGAPVDVFLAADAAHVDELVDENLVARDSRAIYGRGRLSLWTPRDAPVRVSEPGQLVGSEIRRVAIANPAHAPYGVAAKQMLEAAGVLDRIRDKLVLGQNVRQALAYAETGSADVACVPVALCLKTDGHWTVVPDALHPGLEQAVGIVKASRDRAGARRFIDYLLEGEGKEILGRNGIGAPAPGAAR